MDKALVAVAAAVYGMISSLCGSVLELTHADPIRVFHFPRLSQKRLLRQTVENEYRQSHFDLTRENAIAGTLEVSKGGRGGLPLAHDLAGKV